MSLKLFDTKDAVPESLRDSAVETKDGKWAVSDATGLKINADRLLDEKKQLQAKYDELTGKLGGLTPEQIAKIRDDAKKAEDEADRKAGDFDKLLAKRLDEQKAEFQRQIDELAGYKGKYVRSQTESAIRSAAKAANVADEDIDTVIELTADKRVRYDEKSGKMIVVDKDGDPTGLTVDKFFAESYRTEKPKFYKPAGGAGGGAGGSTTGSTGGAPAVTDGAGFLSNLDKIASGEVKVVAG